MLACWWRWWIFISSTSPRWWVARAKAQIDDLYVWQRQTGLWKVLFFLCFPRWWWWWLHGIRIKNVWLMESNALFCAACSFDEPFCGWFMILIFQDCNDGQIRMGHLFNFLNNWPSDSLTNDLFTSWNSRSVNIWRAFEFDIQIDAWTKSLLPLSVLRGEIPLTQWQKSPTQTARRRKLNFPSNYHRAERIRIEFALTDRATCCSSRIRQPVTEFSRLRGCTDYANADARKYCTILNNLQLLARKQTVAHLSSVNQIISALPLAAYSCLKFARFKRPRGTSWLTFHANFRGIFTHQLV